jgi:hypothetical protein
MSWSPDSAWLAYTVLSEGDAGSLASGWLFDTAAAPPASNPKAAGQAAMLPSGSPVYRIWASPREDLPSVLIAESRWPLSGPSWSPRGKSIVYERFVPQQVEPKQGVQLGRWEVVLQTALDRKDVLWTSSDVALDAALRAAIPRVACSWSRDGLYLAIPLPGPVHALALLRTDTKRRLHVVDRASLPAWSPDGTKCAFIRRENAYSSLEVLERRGNGFVAPRTLIETGPVVAAPFWTSDGRSIYVVVEKSAPGPHELDLVRYAVDTGEASQVLTLAADAGRRAAKVRGIALDFDRDAERCCFSVDIEGRDTDLAWSIPGDHEIRGKLSPIDASQRIVALAVAPDGRMAAVRFLTPEGLSPPALFDCETQQTALVVPDETSRKHWIALLAGTVQRLLREGLPPATIDGQAAVRPTLLPLPSEVATLAHLSGRLQRIGSFGSLLGAAPGAPRARDPRQSLSQSTVKVMRFHSEPGHPLQEKPRTEVDAEIRLLFDYLRGDFAAAAADLEALDGDVLAPDRRLGLLSLRAQIGWSKGDHAEAAAMAAYLLSCEGAGTQRIEATPRGPVLTTVTSPRQAWARYLAAQLEQSARPDAQPSPGEPAENELPRLRSPLDEADLRLIERRQPPFGLKGRDMPPEPQPPRRP